MHSKDDIWRVAAKSRCDGALPRSGIRRKYTFSRVRGGRRMPEQEAIDLASAGARNVNWLV